MGSLKAQLAKLFEVSLKVTVPNEPDVEPLVAACNGKFGDYQWYDIYFFFFLQKQTNCYRWFFYVVMKW